MTCGVSFDKLRHPNTIPLFKPYACSTASELIDKIKVYDPQVDEALIHKAFLFAVKAHGEQKRSSGEPYYTHPLAVAGKLTEYRLDVASIITALLHDTVEDTDATLDDIEREFGKEIRLLVDGVTKLTKLEGKSEHLKQAENFRKLLIALSEDLRVLLVKLADRAHNMETLSGFPSLRNASALPAKQWRFMRSWPSASACAP